MDSSLDKAHRVEGIEQSDFKNSEYAYTMDNFGNTVRYSVFYHYFDTEKLDFPYYNNKSFVENFMPNQDKTLETNYKGSGSGSGSDGATTGTGSATDPNTGTDTGASSGSTNPSDYPDVIE